MTRVQRIPVVAVAVSLMIIGALFLAMSQATAADSPNCNDHPLFTRMQNMRIVMCKTSDFDSFTFKTGKTTEAVEGKRFDIKYQIEGTNPAPAPLAILRNHQQAIAKIGGKVVYEDSRYTIVKVARDGKEIWAQIDTAWGKGYMLTIVEKQAMTQEVMASAEMFRSGMNANGHVEVPGIYFETGKAELKAESKAALEEVAKLLQGNPALKVYVVGHTDNVASLDLNMKLSQARADAVVQALIAQYKVPGNRLVARGAGPLAPVAVNDSEDGRAKNRRVELVKQ
jgi:OmpA-OmpF porin, OOP family